MLPNDATVSHEKRIEELENKVRFYEELVNQLPHHFTYKNPHIGLRIKKTRTTHSIQEIPKENKEAHFQLTCDSLF
ncbi:PAS domain-containing sensor histidine kinase, partial [Bacillus cereus group sp. BceL175]